MPDILVITRGQELGLHVDMKPFTFHASLPCLEIGDTLLLGVRNEHQVISCKMLLQLANNEDGVNGTSARHKAELNLIDVHHLMDVEVQQLHVLICEFDTMITDTVKGFIITLLEVHNEALLTV